MEFLAFDLRLGYRWSEERQGWVTTVTVKAGPGPRAALGPNTAHFHANAAPGSSRSGGHGVAG